MKTKMSVTAVLGCVGILLLAASTGFAAEAGSAGQKVAPKQGANAVVAPMFTPKPDATKGAKGVVAPMFTPKGKSNPKGVVAPIDKPQAQGARGAVAPMFTPKGDARGAVAPMFTPKAGDGAKGVVAPMFTPQPATR